MPKKAYIIYDTKFGNNKIIADLIMKELSPEFECSIGKVNEIKVSELVKAKPDLVIIGGPVRAGRPSFALTGYIKSLGNKYKKQNCSAPHGAIYCTGAADPPGNAGLKLLNAAKKSGVWTDLLDEQPWFTMADINGPLKEGVDQEIIEFASKIKNIAQ